MKTFMQYARLVILAAAVAIVYTGYSQQAADKTTQQKYHIKLVKNENGKEVVIDKEFASKADMDAFINENKMDAPEIEDDQVLNTNVANDGSKKIVVNETIENGKVQAQVTYYNFTAEEIKQVEKNVIGQKQEGTKVEIHKECKMMCDHDAENNGQRAAQPPPAAVNNAGSAVNNLTDVKVFPNPASGQFSLKFSVAKATNVAIKVTDINGKEVYNEVISNCNGMIEKNIATKNITAGTYIVSIDTGSEKQTTTVVMQ